MNNQINVQALAEITLLESDEIKQLSKVVMFRALEWDRRLIGKWVVSNKAKPNSDTVNYFHLEQTDNGILFILMDEATQLQPYHLSTLNRIEKNLTGNEERFIRHPDDAYVTGFLSLAAMILKMMGWTKSQMRYPTLVSVDISDNPRKDDEFRFCCEGFTKKGSKKKLGSINIDLQYEDWFDSNTKEQIDRIFNLCEVESEN